MEESAVAKDETVTQIIKESKISIDRLHEAKPYHDISIKNENPESKAPTDAAKSNENPGTPSSANENATDETPSKIETVFEKLTISNEKAERTTCSIELAKEKTPIPLLNLEGKDAVSEPHDDTVVAETPVSSRNSGTIYSVKGSPSGRISRKRDSNTSVFPVGCMGCKEEHPLEVAASPRRFLDANEASQDFAGHLENTPRKRPVSGRPEVPRNPVTGAGVEPTESRRQMIKRKDGNPLLGTGYEESNNTPSTNRIPPGGYSNGLW